MAVKVNHSALTKRQQVRQLEAQRDALMVKKAKAAEELAKTRDALRRAKQK